MADGKVREKSVKIAEETLRHKEVFEIYYAMGDARSLRSLSDIVQSHNDTLEKWSSQFKWQERVKERDAELMRHIQNDFKDEVVRYRALYIQMVKGFIEDCFEIGEDGKRTNGIKPKSIKDFETLVNLHMKLMGDKGEPLGGDELGKHVGHSTVVIPATVSQNDWMKSIPGSKE